jgi:GT2 family glycosyltransferase
VSFTPPAPALSIVIPTFNRAIYVLSTVEQVLRQDFQDFELLVVDQSGSEEWEKVMKGMQVHASDARVSYLHLDRPGLPNARNEALVRVRGAVVLFLDDDVVLLSDSFLRAHVACFDNPIIGGVTGRIVERINRENARRTMLRITLGGRTKVNLLGRTRCRIDSLKGANMSMRASAIGQIGGFDRSYGGTALLEDADYAERLRRQGWGLMFEPDAELLHLSAPAAGVRAGDPLASESSRFRSTAYFIRKHRGRSGLLPFAAVHCLVAASKTFRSMRRDAPLHLLRGALAGLRQYRLGTDETLPRSTASARDTRTPPDATVPAWVAPEPLTAANVS